MTDSFDLPNSYWADEALVANELELLASLVGLRVVGVRRCQFAYDFLGPQDLVTELDRQTFFDSGDGYVVLDLEGRQESLFFFHHESAETVALFFANFSSFATEDGPLMCVGAEEFEGWTTLKGSTINKVNLVSSSCSSNHDRSRHVTGVSFELDNGAEFAIALRLLGHLLSLSMANRIAPDVGFARHNFDHKLGSD